MKAVYTTLTLIALSACSAQQVRGLNQMSDGFARAAAMGQQDPGPSSTGGGVGGQVQFCKVNNFGSVGLCFNNAATCQGSLLPSETCVAR